MHRDGLPRNVIVPPVSTRRRKESEEVALGTHHCTVNVGALHVDLCRVVSLAQESVVAFSQPFAQLEVSLLSCLDSGRRDTLVT